jgi:hypothetical protein
MVELLSDLHKPDIIAKQGTSALTIDSNNKLRKLWFASFFLKDYSRAPAVLGNIYLY